jgi:exodeoxyribonuclease VII large subunit
LFDADRKQPPPFHLKRVIVITSPTGAALQDFLRVLKNRGTPIEILILPVRVQGVEAPTEIARAVRHASELKGDLVVLTRGGGSLEDLWAFNVVVVARAIADCSLPIVSAVGHEVDFTISDFVADLRLPTPTAGAHLVADLVEGLFQNFEDKKIRLCEAISDRISANRVDLNLQIQRLKSESPLSNLPYYRRRIDETIDRCVRALKQSIKQESRNILEYRTRMRTSLEKILLQARSDSLVQEQKLLAFNPQSTLNRGYARVETSKTQRPVRTRNEVPSDEDIRIQLSDGSFEATPHV